MKTQEVKTKIEKMIENGNYVGLRNWLDSLAAPIYFKVGEENYTENHAAATYDRNGSCTNSFIKCEDGFIEYPF